MNFYDNFYYVANNISKVHINKMLLIALFE